MIVRRKQNDELYHHGIKGQKWGVRRYQNPDGSLTGAGRNRYRNADGTPTEAGRKRYERRKNQLLDWHGNKKDAISVKKVNKYINSDGSLTKKANKEMDYSIKFINKHNEKLKKQIKKKGKKDKNFIEDRTAVVNYNQNLLNKMYKAKDLRVIEHKNAYKRLEAQRRLSKATSIVTDIGIASIGTYAVIGLIDAIKK